MEDLVKKGKARNIGVSKSVIFPRECRDVHNHHFASFSFSIRRLQNLTANPLEIQPALNQVELSYWNPQPELVEVRRILMCLVSRFSELSHIVVSKKWSAARGVLAAW